jgi:hypothetical protein
MDVRMFVNSNVRNAYIWELCLIVGRHSKQTTKWKKHTDF